MQKHSKIIRAQDLGEWTRCAWEILSEQPSPSVVETPLAALIETPQPETTETAEVVEAKAEVTVDETELQAIRDAAQQAGYQQGYASGEAQGRQIGQHEGYDIGLAQGREQAKIEIERLQNLLASVDEALASIDKQFPQAILDIALAVAQQMLGVSLRHQPEQVLTVIREALASLPQLQQSTLQLRMHPDDIEGLAPLLKSLGTIQIERFIADPAIERGGCFIVGSHLEVDLSLATRWQQVIAALGRDDRWYNDASAKA